MNKIPKQHIILGITELIKDKFKPVKNRIFVKPEGGIWSCPYIIDGKFVSDWHEWCDSEMPHWISNDSIIFELKDNAKVYIIDNEEDLKNLVDVVGKQENNIIKFQTFIDFQNACNYYDAIFLTRKGQYETRHGMGLNLYGWDVESLLILNFDCIRKWEYKKLDIIKECV